MNFRYAIIFILIAIGGSACAPAELPSTPTPSERASPTQLPSATIDWFPATESPTVLPTQSPMPTVDLHPNLGNLILDDDFSSAAPWPDTATQNTRVSVDNDRLNLYSNIQGVLLLAPRNAPVVNNFYLEVTANTSLCDSADEYGLMLRITSSGDYYRFTLSCDGRAKLDRVFNGAVSAPVLWQNYSVIPAMAPSIVHLSVWASGTEMRFFVNDLWIFTSNDTVLYSGRVGAFIRARGEGPLSVSFSDLNLYALEE